jgi:hypothetical protein
MKKGSVFVMIIMIVVFVVVLAGGVLLFFANVFSGLYESVEFSPLEDKVFILNTEKCFDGDAGIFFNEKGRVYYKRGFLIEWETVNEDKCEGNGLIEYYCVDDGLGVGVVNCESGCSDGACLDS